MSTPYEVPERTAHPRTTTLLALVVPGTIIAMSAIMAWAWRAELPDPVATHWGPNGVDGFHSLRWDLTGTTLIAVIMVIAFWGVGLWFGRSASTRRIVNATSTWLATLFAGIQLLPLNAQRGLTDASQVGDVTGLIVLSLVAASIFGVTVALVTPGDQKSPATEGPPSDAARMPLKDTERAVWVARTTSTPTVLSGIVAILTIVVITIAIQQFWLLGVAVLLGLMMAAIAVWTVRVDATGLTVRSLLGYPRTHQPIEEIVRADVVSVQALREFGGWGWRVGKGGRSAVVLRSGEALEVTRTGGRKFLVTVEEPAAAAALINTYADRIH